MKIYNHQAHLVFYLKIVLFLLFWIGNVAYSQNTNFTTNDYWKQNRKEFLFGFGLSNFLGDLGGRDQIGTDYSPIDLDWPVTRISGHIGYRYRLRPWLSSKTNFIYAMLEGNDALTFETYRHYRNLSFRTHLFELSEHLELIIFNRERYGHRFGLKGLKGLKNKNTWIYVYSGVSFFAFIPKSLDGKKLRPLRTEGQGLPGGPEPYGIVNLGIPFGIGYRIGINHLWRMSFELCYTKTFTDYIDDVSGNYYDKTELLTAYGEESAHYSDLSSGVFSSWTNPGEIRGDPTENDAYLLFNVSIIRKITKYKYSGSIVNKRARF
jgi:hypothetical protein